MPSFVRQWFGARWWGALATFLALIACMSGGAGASPNVVDVQRTQGRIPVPVVEPARGGACLESPAYMRRNHPDLLMHQRDETLRGGVRKARHSLKACIACHASQTTNSVTASSANFCQSCHAYVAVRIDCFECHASHPQVKP